jgi:ferric-dicitrate binding protein FerR (iron transport regulator)
LVYPEKFTSNKREIQLEGEGLFKVHADKKKPFIVKTGLIDIIATGTQFNVSAYPDDNWISTALIEGAVKLQSDISSRIFELKSGQIAIYDKQEQRITAKNIDPDSQISWIHGEYRFETMALIDITKRLERYYDIVFVFEDETLKQRQFTGAFFNNQSIETIMRVIETSTQTQCRLNDRTISIK